MVKEIQNPTKEILENSKYYKEFLEYLGIDPEDFQDEFDVEFDDCAK